jgi:hypothetical protein
MMAKCLKSGDRSALSSLSCGLKCLATRYFRAIVSILEALLWLPAFRRTRLTEHGADVGRGGSDEV